MTGPLAIALEPAKILSAAAEARLLQDVLEQKPTSIVLRRTLGRLCNELDQFDQTVALLAPSLGQLDTAAALTLARACFALRDEAHLDLARIAADHAVLTAKTIADRARAMADQAKVQLRVNDSDAAIATLRAALALDNRSVAAFKRLAAELLRQGDAAAVEALTADLLADGVCHARVLAARTMALAAIGRGEDARSTVGITRFLKRAPITLPPGWESLAQFNTALASELTGDPALRHNRYGTASSLTHRLDSPTAGTTPVWIALLEQIARAVEQWANALPPTGHPWLAARPERALLRSWCVITDAEGHERWHMHPDGWLSGGYYPLVPRGLDVSTGKAGHIAFGLPDGLPGADAAMRFGEVSVLPEAGELMLFPSHAHHRTYPHGTAARRICVAFDIIPI